MKRAIAPVFVSLLLLLSTSAPAGPEEYQGIVNHVYDAATIRMAYKGGQIRVRLFDLQPPDTVDGRENLSRLLLGKKVSVKVVRWQKGFLIGRVFADGRCICGKLAGIGKDEAVKNFALTITGNLS